MPKDEWGLKRACPNCAARFYDLRRDPMTCPACGAVFSVESLTAGRTRPARADKAKPEVDDAEELPDTADEPVIEADDDIDDDILEDEEDNVDLEEIADVAADDEET